VLLSVGNNFFYTKSLPCTLWFFDKGKPETLQDKVLFIDARNYYTVVDRTLNEWSEWQMKNLNAIVWLYRGEAWKYKGLLLTYQNTVRNLWWDISDSSGILLKYLDVQRRTFISECMRKIVQRIDASDSVLTTLSIIPELTTLKQTIIDQSKSMLEEMGQLNKYEFESLMKELSGERLVFRTYKRLLPDNTNNLTEQIDVMISVLTEAKFLTDCFGDGEYHDIPGLCKIASRAEIKEKHWSLTPGAYVGVTEQQSENDEDFAVRMKQIHTELKALQAESHQLMNTISNNFEEMGL
jgi:type I restriction enzyme M protein